MIDGIITIVSLLIIWQIVRELARGGLLPDNPFKKIKIGRRLKKKTRTVLEPLRTVAEAKEAHRIEKEPELATKLFSGQDLKEIIDEEQKGLK